VVFTLPKRIDRCGANMAHIRQSRPYSGLGFQVKFLKIFELFPLFSRAACANTFRGGLVFKAHRLVYHSTLGSKEIKKKKKTRCASKARVSRAKKISIVVDYTV